MATTEPQKWTATLGSTADVNALPATTPSGSGRASFSGLFPPVTQLPLDQGGIAPERGDFNALFKYLGEYLFYLMQGGMFSYSTDYDYTAGNLVMHGGSLYLCIAANGPGSVIKYPTDAAYWRQLALTSQLPTVNNGTLTIQNNGATVATFSANQAGNTTANISVPTVNNGTLTIQQDGVTVGTFTANQSGNSTVNITGGGGTFSGTILGGYVGSASDSPGIYSGTVGFEYNNYELFGSVFGSYPPGTKFECVVASSASLSTYTSTPVYKKVTFGAFKLKSLGNGMIRYLFKRSAPSVGSTVTSDSDRYITGSNTVWAEDVILDGTSVSTGNVVVMVKWGYVLPSGTSYVVDSIIATYEHPGESGTPGWGGSPCYKCLVHTPS